MCPDRGIRITVRRQFLQGAFAPRHAANNGLFGGDSGDAAIVVWQRQGTATHIPPVAAIYRIHSATYMDALRGAHGTIGSTAVYPRRLNWWRYRE